MRNNKRGPEIKVYDTTHEANRQLRTDGPQLFVAGEGVGRSRGIVGASFSASTLFAATLLALAITALSLRCLAPVDDPDVFWHLKTGEWIADHRSLPTTDPFAFTTPTPVSADQRFVLTSYWLGQLFLQAVCSVAGLGGIVVARFVLAALIALVLLRRREGDFAVYSGLLVTFAGMSGIYALERPQAWSFLFFAALVGLLDTLRKDGPSPRHRWFAAAAVPLLMLLWANTHAGAIPGQALILLVLALEAARRFLSAHSPEGRKRFRQLALSGVSGLVASLVNPNGWHALAFTRLLFGTGDRNQEMWSSFEAFRALGTPAAPALWFFVLFTAVALVGDRRRVDIVDAVLLVAVGWVSLAHLRYLAYFPLAALPVAARHVSRTRLATPLTAAALIGGTLSCGALLREGIVDRAFLSPEGKVNSFVFPVAAAGFIESEQPGRQLYNNMNWGGYLIWRLGPAWQVFVDTRISGPDVFAEAAAVDSAAADDDNGRPRWKAILSRRGVGCVLTPVYSTLGVVYPLVGALLSDPDWVPVFIDLNQAVFVVKSAGNRKIIARQGLPRRDFLSRLLTSLDNIAAARPGDPAPRIAKGDILSWLSRPDHARREYEAAARLAPLHPVARQRLGVRVR